MPPVFDVTFEPTKSLSVERIKVEGPEGWLVGDVGPSHAIAAEFGSEMNPARYAFLRSLKGKVAWIDRIKVGEDFRGQGFGTNILRTALKALADRGVRYALLHPRPETPDDAEQLDRFYERFGFREMRQFKGEPLWWRLLILKLAKA
jgi:GNAT superfamily N-acetyltransferase